MVYTIQAEATGNGWTLFRAAGITQHVEHLGYAKRLIEACGGRLIVLDKAGNRLN